MPQGLVLTGLQTDRWQNMKGPDLDKVSGAMMTESFARYTLYLAEGLIDTRQPGKSPSGQLAPRQEELKHHVLHRPTTVVFYTLGLLPIDHVAILAGWAAALAWEKPVFWINPVIRY